jgi:4-carboxymuconolactone decarboxylase
MSRFPALAPEAMSAEQRAVADEISSGPRGGVRGPYVALLHHPALARKLQALGEHLRFNTQFGERVLEIGILVTARHWNCQYEWVAHERLARKAGVPEPIIDAIRQARVPDSMSEDEARVHRFCSEAVRHGEPGEAAYDAVVRRFGREGVLDLLALCGYYATLALVLNTARLPLPDGVPPPLGRADGTVPHAD